jgi:CRISPR-associated protein Csx17
MTLHIHKLDGCAPTPLAHYLKALAILRLVAEQRDASVRGWWKDEAFWLATELSREELMHFFLWEYAPTPILSPWNGGSGFFYENDEGLTPIERSTARRFAAFRDGIASARAMSAPLARAIARVKEAENGGDAELKAARAEKDHEKDVLLACCRRHWTGGLLEWFDAALALEADGSAAWPALLGSGGNDGRLDFTNNSMQHLATLFDCADPIAGPVSSSAQLLQASLFGCASPGLLRKAVGQFLPGKAGGDNMGAGFEADAEVNPWDFVLTLEGTLMLASSLVRSTDTAGLPQAAAPFAVRSSGSGYGSATGADEGPRGEQWMPLWSHPCVLAEVRALFSEGRTRVGRSTSVRALDAARAVARLGVARGVSSFERYGYIERNGQANLAVPLGRWTVSAQPHEDLLDDLDPWLSHLRAFARDSHAPKAITSAARVVDEAILAVCRTGSMPEAWQALLVALGRAEGALLRSPKAAGDPKRRLAPLPPLRIEWLDAANDGTPELRLAIALASQDVALRLNGREMFGNVRAHWMPVDRARGSNHPQAERHAARFATNGGGVAHDPDVVCVRDDLENDCVDLIRRRVQLAPALRARSLGLFGARGAEAPLADVMAFLARGVDDARILSLAKPLMAISWWTHDCRRVAAPRGNEIDAVYAVVRVAHLSEPLDRGGKITIKLDPEAIARLSSGALGDALAVCNRRLRASGLVPVLHHAVGARGDARRLAASLAFPIRAIDAGRCADLVTKPYEEGNLDHAD